MLIRLGEKVVARVDKAPDTMAFEESAVNRMSLATMSLP